MTRSRAQRPSILLLTLAVCACAGAGAAPPAGLSAPAAPPAEPIAPRAATSVGFLVVDGVYNSELIAPFDVFEHAGHHLPAGRSLEVFTVSPDGAGVETAEGLHLRPDYGFANAPPIDILVVPSAEGSRDSDLEDEALIAWVAATGAKAQTVMSLCWGAFVLAKAGLLEDRACTTFPGDYSRFAKAFPDLDLRFNVSFVHDRDRLTSQGGVRSYEAAMYLVDHLFGEEVAVAVGSGLLIPWPPSLRDRPAMVSASPTGD
jgi:transcriptional regulator GlxA family with amidase domain